MLPGGRVTPSRALIGRIPACCAAILAALAVAGPPALAEPWPQRPVRFVLPLGPGSGTDIAARLFAERLAQRWGQPVVVENRPGGDSFVAIAAFLGANDDHIMLFSGFLKDAGLDIAGVPYRDITQAVGDLGEARIQLMSASLTIVQPQVQAG